jgi:hypothetical protein
MEFVLEPFVVENLRWSGNQIKFEILGVNDEDPFDAQRLKPLTVEKIRDYFST